MIRLRLTLLLFVIRMFVVELCRDYVKPMLAAIVLFALGCGVNLVLFLVVPIVFNLVMPLFGFERITVNQAQSLTFTIVAVTSMMTFVYHGYIKPWRINRMLVGSLAGPRWFNWLTRRFRRRSKSIYQHGYMQFDTHGMPWMTWNNDGQVKAGKVTPGELLTASAATALLPGAK